MTRCIVCKKEKAETDFNWKNKDAGIRKNYCRVCDREIKKKYYQRNRAELIAYARKQTKSRSEKFQTWKATLKCSLCPESDSVCLDFHHLDPNEKDFGLSNGAPNMSWKRLMEEVKKCIVVCKNCHAKIHKYGLEHFN